MSSTRPVWFAAVVVFVFATILFPLRTERLNRGLEGVFVAPDAMASYDERVLAETFNVVAGEYLERRLAYARSELTLDVAFPAAYVSLLALLLLAIYPGAGARASRSWRAIAIGVPLAAGSADLVENVLLAGLARRQDWEKFPGDLKRIAGSIAEDAARAALATSIKRGLLMAAIGLLVFALWRSGRLGRLVTLLWLGRVSVLALAALVALALFGGADRTSPTLPNMLVLGGAGQMFAVGYLAATAAVLAGFALLLTWELAPLRFTVQLPVLPRFLATRPAADPWRNAVFLVFALPLVIRAVLRSGDGALSTLGLAAAALVGLTVAVAVLSIVELVRRGLVGISSVKLRAAIRALANRLGPGYENPATGEFLDGHGLASAFAVMLTAVYFFGQWFLDPGRAPARTAMVPTLGYVLGLVAILSSILGGAAFFFDRWRIPLVAVILLWVALINFARPMEHEFEWQWSTESLPAANRAAEARLAQGPPRILTVVTASGGGIQAAAWTARVLTGLQQELGPDFTRSIALVSSVSGGSVGAWFALSAVADQGADAGAMPGEALEAVFAASTESSLEPTAWALLYPDLQRGLHLFVPSTRDRGWAMERGWLAALRKHGLDPAGRRQDFSAWVRAARAGTLPGVIFNATRIDDGMPLRLATVGRRDGAAPAAQVEAPLIGLDPDFSYRHETPEPGHLAIPAVTAARLSASFPYVSPIARPRRHEDAAKPMRLWHAADGGYFDNNGTVAALAWLYELQRAWGDDLASQVDRVLWIQIDAFPETDPGVFDHDPGWTMSAIGPLKGLLRVRVGSQRVRRAMEVELEQRLQRDRLQVVILRPPKPAGPHRDAPVSWALGREDRERLQRDWQAVKQSQALGSLRPLFPHPVADAP
jgi:hypothetical protein